MSNELNANEQTNSILYSFNAKPGQEQEYFVKYKVSPRQGATPDMINDTVKHFKLAIRTLVAGVTNVSDNIPDRPQWAEPITHAEPRVVIYSFGGFNVPVSEGLLERVDINVFNEFSTASDCVAHMWMAIRAMADGEHKDDLLSSNGHVTKSQKPKSELDKHFGERKQSPSPAAPVNGSTPLPVPGESIVDIDYDYKQHEFYNTEYVGRKVRVFVEKILWAMESKKDKSGSYEIIQLYKKAHYEKPIYNLSIWPPKPDDKYGNGKELCRVIPELQKPGDFVTGDIIIEYKLNKSSKEGDDRVFWNIENVTYPQQATPQAQPEPQADDVPEEHPGDEIPF